MAATTVTRKGQVTVPRDVREPVGEAVSRE
jgi:bifunctional DNA-binding transcriptional regulator/antitoxin component of YhaV-PrlF toxin-antitoxin module